MRPDTQTFSNNYTPIQQTPQHMTPDTQPASTVLYTEVKQTPVTPKHTTPDMQQTPAYSYSSFKQTPVTSKTITKHAPSKCHRVLMPTENQAAPDMAEHVTYSHASPSVPLLCSPTARSFNDDSWEASLYSPMVPIQNQIQNLTPSETTHSALSVLNNECGNCLLKDKEMHSLRQYCQAIGRNLGSVRSEISRLREETENRPPSVSRMHLDAQEANHYYPRRGQRIDKCEYIIKDQEASHIPEDYVALAPGQAVYVRSDWLNHVQASFRGKTKAVALKNMMSGIYEPEDILGHTSASLLVTPMGKALREYCISKLNLDGTHLVDAINSKIGTMKRALKSNRVRRF